MYMNIGLFVNKYVNEYQAISLVEAMERTSLNACRVIEDAVPQMKNKGRVQVGKDADLVIFKLEEFKDTATFTVPNSLSQGMRYVFVNGIAIIENGELNRNALLGQPIRRTPIV